ncbi:hypothetical protein AB0P05_13870 [Streptomyces flaveolus]
MPITGRRPDIRWGPPENFTEIRAGGTGWTEPDEWHSRVTDHPA